MKVQPGQGRGRSKGRGRAQNPEYVTREDLVVEIGKLQATLQTLLGHHQNTKTENTENPEPSEVAEENGPIATTSDSHPVLTPSAAIVQKGCDYKMFLACKPPTGSC